jgi:hypothetical protein
MLLIEFCEVEDEVAIGELFDEIGFQTASSEETLISNDFAIDVLSFDGYYSIDAFRRTQPEEIVEITTESGKSLIASPSHLLVREEEERHKGIWRKISELSVGDKISTIGNELEIVKSIKMLEGKISLCDMQVAISHSYYANDLLSHNSHFLTFAGANALRAGKNVLHYTFELSEEQIGLRYDSNLCGINSSDVIENREKVLESYKNENYGKLMIKYFPTSFPTVNTLRAHVEKLKLKGFYPDVILVDYADIMRSTRQFDSLRHELKLVYEELRGLAGELGLPLWTASQSNKEGADSEVIDLTNMSEAYGKAFIADCVVTISRRSIEKATGKGRLFVAKNRFGTDGILFQIGIDTGTSTFTITSDQEIPKSSSPAEEEMNLKASIKEKWKTLMPTKEILPSQNAT